MIRVVAAILKRNNTYFIARRAPHKMHPGKWEFPGGKIDFGESPELALERELFEEFGVVTKTGKHVLTIKHDYGNFQIKLMAYKSEYIKGAFHLNDHDQIAWVNLNSLEDYDFSEADLTIVANLQAQNLS